MKHSKEIKQKISNSLKGLSPLWKGEKAGYRTKHYWMNTWFGRPHNCEECGLDKIPEGKKQWFDWANISGKYIRDRSDWKRLCRRCHRNMDAHLRANGEKNGSAKLTEKQVRVIKWALHYGTSSKYLAQAFKVHKNTICNIKLRKHWAHVTIPS